MIIDTTSRENIERDMIEYFDITIKELRSYIYCAGKKSISSKGFNAEKFNQEISLIIDEMKSANRINEVLCFHLSRRLNKSFDDIYNLKKLLLGENSITQFLKEYQIIFKEKHNYLVLFHQGQEISLDDTSDTEVCYLRSRLGYNDGRQDFCFNGFAMRDQLFKNTYARELFDGPEFLFILSNFLGNKAIIDDFKKASKYYCYTLQIPIDEVIFDGFEEFDNNQKERHLIFELFNRLLMYNYSNCEGPSDNDNPIIRVRDDIDLPATYVINIEEVTLEMIE